MLHCPPSRINLTKADIADFERRSAAKQEAAKLAQVTQSIPRLSVGPGRLTRLNIVQADNNAARGKALSSSSQAVICVDSLDEGERVGAQPPGVALSPPIIRTSDYDDDNPVAERSLGLDGQRNGLPRPSRKQRLRRRDGSMPTHDESLRPPAVDATAERHLRPSTTHQTSWVSGPANLASRSSRQTSQSEDFALYEDSASVQARIEAENLHIWHSRNLPGSRGHYLQPNPIATTRRNPSQSALNTTVRPALPAHLNPGAPAFVPRTRFGSGTGGSEENVPGGLRVSRQATQGTRVSSTQSTSNLRIRSSFERNSQQGYRHQDSYGNSNSNIVSAARPVAIQYRRRSHTSDQNANFPAISSVGERYPALRPAGSIPAPRRSSGAHRQVVFPRRRSSQQHLIDHQRVAIPIPIRSTNDQRRSSTQSKSSSLILPDASNMMRASSAAPSSNSRSTPNLCQATSPVPLIHSRSSSLSWDRFVSQRHTGRRIPSVVSAASGISGSSDEHARRLGHMSFEESMLSRESPLDELLLDFSHLFPNDGRPRSVGRSFQQSPGSHTRISLLSGGIFQQNVAHEQEDVYLGEHGNTGRHPLKIANDSSFSEDDAVALSLALPSPNMPSSSPTINSWPHFHAPTPMVGASTSNLTSSITPPPQSICSLTQVQDDATPRVHVYDDRRSPRTQPQTPADIRRSARQARSRGTTMSHQEVGAVAEGLFSPIIPERRPHRPYTYPAGTPPSMIDSAAIPGRPGIVGVQGVRQSLNVRGSQRSSGSSENDVEGSLAGLDADRRTWMARREEGSLETTPPREGRFERYLR